MKLKTIQNNIIIIIFSLFFLESCKNLPGADARKVSYDPKKRVQKNIEEGRGFRLMGGNKKNSGEFDFASSDELWRASLDTLDFMPYETIDPFGGIIITDWFINQNNEKIRNKITVSFSSSELRATSIKVSVIREKFDNNQWVSDGYSDGLARKIEDLILTRARELRSKNS